MKRLALFTLVRLVVCCIAPSTVYGQADEPDIVSTYPAITGERIYIVEEGDTLWDICDQFFDDPHFWPTLWAFNAQITNPHWIYPGDQVVIIPKSMLNKGPGFVWARSRYSEKPTDIVVAGRSKGFIPEKVFQESGKIRYSREQKQYLGQYDEVYIEFYIPKKIKKGEEFTLYRVESDVTHPVTGDKVGYKVRHLGIAKVLGAEKRFVKALLFTTYEEIERGTLVTDIFQQQFKVGPAPNTANVDAVILDAFEDYDYLGEHHYVFLDKGRNDGVQLGNRFVVLDRGDGYDPVESGDMEDLPDENVGEIMIVEPYDNTSLGVVTRSISELAVGQKCALRVNYGRDRPPEEQAKQDGE
jgi:hypothetical protein